MDPTECQKKLESLGFRCCFDDHYAFMHRCHGALFPGVTFTKGDCRIRIWYFSTAMSQLKDPSEEALAALEEHNKTAMEEAELWESVLTFCS